MAGAASKDIRMKPFQCKICPAKFATKAYLLRHEQRHTDKLPYECSECGQKFKLKDYLQRHLKKKHSKGAEEGTECVVCQKIFGTKEELAEHENDEAHKCLICVDLTYRDYLERKKKADDDEEEEEEPETLQCEFCDMTFYEKIVMYHHLHTDHMEKVGAN